MTDISDISDSSNQTLVLSPKTLVDEASSTLYYIGISINGGDTSAPIWSIKKIEKIGNVWITSAYPNGMQDFEFIWNNRTIYAYL